MPDNFSKGLNSLSFMPLEKVDLAETNGVLVQNQTAKNNIKKKRAFSNFLLFKQKRKENITLLLEMYKSFLLLLSLFCISIDSAHENSAAAAESHKGTFPHARVVATASSERDLSCFTLQVMLPH